MLSGGILEKLQQIMQKITSPAYNPDTDSNEALREAIDVVNSDQQLILGTVRDIAITGSALNAVASGAVVTYGTETGSYIDTQLANGNYHKIAAVNAGASPYNIDLYYRFNIGSGLPVEVSVLGRLVEGSPPYGQDSIDTFVYDWVGGAWDHISPASGDFIGSNSTVDTTEVMTLIAKHVGIGANEGEVRIRFAGNVLKSGTVFWVDQILLRYAEAITADINEIKTAVADVPTLAEMNAAFTEIKGAGWSNETLKAIYDASGGGSGLTAQQKALLFAEPYYTRPLIENWAGTKASETVEDNNSMTAAQRTLWNSRYTDAVTWVKRIPATNATLSIGPFSARLSINSYASQGGFVALHPFVLDWYQKDSLFANDTTLIWECLARAGTSSGNHPYIFFGLANVDPAGDYNSAPASTFGKFDATAVRRIGFAGDSANSGIGAYAVCANGTNYSHLSSARFVLSNFTHLKFVWKRTGSIDFYVNGTLIGTLSTNLPTSGDADVAYYPFFFTGVYGSGATWGYIDVNTVRCYYQNGE